MINYRMTAPGRNSNPHHQSPVDHRMHVDAAGSALLVAAQLTSGGRLIHKRTHRCTAFCNQLADLAGLGAREVR